METVLGLLVGVGLSAACGFRVFVPCLFLSIASWSGHVRLGPSWEWIGSTPALAAFGLATIVEALGYLIPWVDHMLDAMALPLAAVAGTILTGAMVADVSPFLRWSLAAIAGGGVALGTRATMAAMRAGSTATTAGLANPVLSLFEAGFSFVLSILALVVPLLALLLFAAAGAIVARMAWKLVRRGQIPADALRICQANVTEAPDAALRIRD